jgi:ribosomal 50S subunit-recycling heat shock protein
MSGASARKSVQGSIAAAYGRPEPSPTLPLGNSGRPCDQENIASGSIRIDKWLFHARFYKTRPLAQAAACAGKVRLNGTRVEKPARTVRPGDILTLGKGKELISLRILALAERRGPALEARALYEIVAD